MWCGVQLCCGCSCGVGAVVVWGAAVLWEQLWCGCSRGMGATALPPVSEKQPGIPSLSSLLHSQRSILGGAPLCEGAGWPRVRCKDHQYQEALSSRWVAVPLLWSCHHDGSVALEVGTLLPGHWESSNSLGISSQLSHRPCEPIECYLPWPCSSSLLLLFPSLPSLYPKAPHLALSPLCPSSVLQETSLIPKPKASPF